MTVLKYLMTEISGQAGLNRTRVCGKYVINMLTLKMARAGQEEHCVQP